MALSIVKLQLLCFLRHRTSSINKILTSALTVILKLTDTLVVMPLADKTNDTLNDLLDTFITS